MSNGIIRLKLITPTHKPVVLVSPRALSNLTRVPGRSVLDVISGKPANLWPALIGGAAATAIGGTAVLGYHTNEQISAQLDNLITTAKVLNETVWDLPGWGDVYGEIIRFVEASRSNIDSWYEFGFGIWNSIEERFQKLEQWRQKAIEVGRTPIEGKRETPQPNNPLSDAASSISSLLWGVAAIGAIGLGVWGISKLSKPKTTISISKKSDTEEDEEEEE